MDNIQKDLSEVLSNVWRSTISTGMDDITDSLHKTVAIIEDRNNEKVENQKQYT